MSDSPKIELGKLVQTYVALRDRVAEIKASQKATLAPYDKAMSDIEQLVLGELNASGADSVKTPFGTAYKTEKVSMSVADKSAFMDYIEGNQAFDLLDVRANKTAVELFLTEHQDLPPGVNCSKELKVNFRRA